MLFYTSLMKLKWLPQSRIRVSVCVAQNKLCVQKFQVLFPMSLGSTGKDSCLKPQKVKAIYCIVPNEPLAFIWHRYLPTFLMQGD